MDTITFITTSRLLLLRMLDHWAQSKRTRREVARRLGFDCSGRGDWPDNTIRSISCHIGGVRFVVQPAGFGPGRLQAECPKCHKAISLGLFGNLQRHNRKCLPYWARPTRGAGEVVWSYQTKSYEPCIMVGPKRHNKFGRLVSGAAYRPDLV